jgi:hypothetical protein
VGWDGAGWEEEKSEERDEGREIKREKGERDG